MGTGSSKLSGGGGGGAVTSEDIEKKELMLDGLKQFGDVAKDTHDYDVKNPGKDGSEQVDFFKENSNYDELISEMSSEERRAWESGWCPGYFMDGSQYRGWDAMTSREQEWTRTFDKYLDRATLDKPVEVVRLATGELALGAGKRTGTLADYQAMVGQTVLSKGSMSTGAARTGLSIGDSSKQCEYRIKVPGGSTGAGMWIGDSRINHWGAKQREFMTNRDSFYRIDRVHENRYGKIVVDMTWIGRDQHDYGKSGK